MTIVSRVPAHFARSCSTAQAQRRLRASFSTGYRRIRRHRGIRWWFRYGDFSELRLAVTDHGPADLTAGGPHRRQAIERNWSSSLPIASRSTSCCGPSLNCSSLHRSRG